ncbi:MAG TPA: TetR/AcrR family transcriptional regulator [Ferruginibacter sp.]|nr:TetR/AcrR family transcriptional regulator [Ferruginibacter sp.]
MAKIKASRNGTKKDAITKKAAALFRKKGFVASSMRELAENIGVEASSLYNHIGSKSEILQTICFKVANDFNLHIDEVEKLQEDSLAKLENLVRFHVHMMVDLFDEVYVANHEWKQLKEPYLSNFLNQRKIYEARMIQIVKDGVDEGTLKPIQPHIAVLTILSAVRGIEYWQRHKKEYGISELENDMTEQLLHGLTK